MQDAIEAAGVRLLYLPSYTSDFDPTEQAFTRFTPQECRTYLAVAGYEND